MNRYKIYCTPEQTQKALKLGAPIKIECFSTATEDHWHEVIPTAEEMIGWLEEQGILVDVHFYCISWDIGVRTKTGYIVAQKLAIDSRKEAEIAAIDAALEYLTKQKIWK